MDNIPFFIIIYNKSIQKIVYYNQAIKKTFSTTKRWKDTVDAIFTQNLTIRAKKVALKGSDKMSFTSFKDLIHSMID